MLEQNPFLEAEEEPRRRSSRWPSARRRRARRRARGRARRPSSGRVDGGDEPSRRRRAPSSAPPSATTGRTAPSATTSTASARRPSKAAPAPSDDDDFEPHDRDRARRRALQDHLRRQLRWHAPVARGRAPRVHVLIESLNDDGYLDDRWRRSPTALAGAERRRREQRGAARAPARARCKWLQSLEPAGVGARDLAECLTLQLRARPRDAQAQTVAHHRSASSHLDLLARRDLKRLIAATGADEDAAARGAQALIVALRAQAGPAVLARRGATSSCPT